MRLPLASDIDSRDGTSSKDSSLTNMLKEVDEGDYACIRPGLEEVTTTLSAGNGNGIVSFNDDLLSVFGANLSIADVNPPVVVSFPVIEVLDDLVATYPGQEEAYPTDICTGADEEGYSNIVIVGWGIGPNFTQGYEDEYYIFRWEESLGYEMIPISPALGLSYDFRDAASVTPDGETVFMAGVIADNQKIKIYKWTRAGGTEVLGPDASIGDDPGNSSGMTKVRNLSSDGLCCVGTFRPLVGLSRAFKWTEAGGFVDLDPTSTQSYANDSSDGGSVICGTYVSSGVTYPGKWTQSGGWVSLGSLGGTSGVALYISADGSIICGVSMNGANANRGVIWTEADGMVDLDATETYSSIGITAMSRDGSTIVGYKVDPVNGAYTHAYKWDEDNKFVSLIYPGEYFGYATSVSDDGTVIVGLSTMPTTFEKIAWKWTEETGMVSLGTTGTYDYEAYHVSADGTAITGNAWATADTYPIYPYVLGGTDVLPRFRSLVDLEDVPMDFAQSTL